jgi:hypothetical protein
MASASQVAAKTKLKKLLITNQMSTWVEDKGTTRTFTAQELFDVINGGAEEYINRGLIGGIHQQFSGTDGKTFEVFVEDFGDTAKSAAMIAAKKESFTETGSIPELSEVSSFSSKAIGALVVVAAVGRFYIEMTASGFTDNKEAEKAAVAFVGYYRKMIGNEASR